MNCIKECVVIKGDGSDAGAEDRVDGCDRAVEVEAKVCPLCAFAWHDDCALDFLGKLSSMYARAGDEGGADAAWGASTRLSRDEDDDDDRDDSRVVAALSMASRTEFFEARERVHNACQNVAERYNRTRKLPGWWHWIEPSRAQREIASIASDAHAGLRCLVTTLVADDIGDKPNPASLCPVCSRLLLVAS